MPDAAACNAFLIDRASLPVFDCQDEGKQTFLGFLIVYQVPATDPAQWSRRWERILYKRESHAGCVACLCTVQKAVPNY